MGEHPKVVSERLGHSNVGITLDTYSHVLPDMQKSLAQNFDLFIKAISQKKECGQIVCSRETKKP
ncbi:hypothetical protein [Melghirimyces algeriensis]|uniref:hypothetical protein n=1 Tax=Melghirimyces algeriensis TaxID=910412 RepID=UPI001C8F6C20